MNWFELGWLFGIPTILNFIACQIAIPYLDQQQILPIEVTYFLSVGLLVLVPMFFGAIYLSGQDIGSYKSKDLLARMRIKKLSGIDLVWTVGTFIFLVLASFIIAKIIMPKLVSCPKDSFNNFLGSGLSRPERSEGSLCPELSDSWCDLRSLALDQNDSHRYVFGDFLL